MTVRDYIYNLVTTDTVLNALGITADSTFVSHDVDTPQERPFCILRWRDVTVGIHSGETSRVNQRNLQVWIHATLGEYGMIDEALKRLRVVLTGVEGVNVGGDDEWLSTICWEGDSDDYRDYKVGTIMRWSMFKLTGSGL